MIHNYHVSVSRAVGWSFGPVRDGIRFPPCTSLPVIGQIACKTQWKGEEDKEDKKKKKRWEDNIREWTGLEFAQFQRAGKAEKNRGKWLWSHLWCPSDPRGLGIGEGEGDELPLAVGGRMITRGQITLCSWRKDNNWLSSAYSPVQKYLITGTK